MTTQCGDRFRRSRPRIASRRRRRCRARYTRRFFGGRQPLCGSGVTSSIDLMVMPAACNAVIALSRPLPGPLTRTSNSLTPNLAAFSALAAPPLAGEGRALAASLETAGAGAGPAERVALGIGDRDLVLLNVALMWAMPTVTLRRTLRRLLFPTSKRSLKIAGVRPSGSVDAPANFNCRAVLVRQSGGRPRDCSSRILQDP